jgi:fatty acid desaturase
MFPMVPYHAMPRLHEVIRHDLPVPNPSILAAYREVWRAVMRQRHEPGHYARRALPPSARPYRGDLHATVPSRASA